MNGKRVGKLQKAYRDLALSRVDRRTRKTGGVSNLRRRLKQFWVKNGRLPHGPMELLEFDGMSTDEAWRTCVQAARA